MIDLVIGAQNVWKGFKWRESCDHRKSRKFIRDFNRKRRRALIVWKRRQLQRLDVICVVNKIGIKNDFFCTRLFRSRSCHERPCHDRAFARPRTPKSSYTRDLLYLWRIAIRRVFLFRLWSIPDMTCIAEVMNTTKTIYTNFVLTFSSLLVLHTC